jgi:LuxR family maltose regulon positive regulatory protein
MVPRRSLIEQLAHSEAAVIAVTAPGGFGKSTLLSQWLRESPKQVVWLQIPAGADSTGVAERIARELSPVPGSSLTVLPTVHDEALWFSVVLPALHDVVSHHPGPFVLVLDDAMNVVDGRIDGLLDTLVTALPVGSQLVVALRGAPPHALRRLRATGRTLELDASDLAMSDDEARLLLDELSVHLPEDQLAELVTRTEGWPVGIYLLGRAILKDPNLLATDEVPGLATDWITDFIRDELFDELAEDEQTVLLRISVLDELTAGACDATADLPGTLQRLRQATTERWATSSGAEPGACWLPVVPLSSSDGWPGCTRTASWPSCRSA